MFFTSRNVSIPPDERWEALLAWNDEFNGAAKKMIKM